MNNAEPITIERLKSFGFKYYEAGKMYLKYKSNPKFLMALSVRGEFYCIGRSGVRFRSIKTIDQLKAFYFALTNESLNELI